MLLPAAKKIRPNPALDRVTRLEWNAKNPDKLRGYKKTYRLKHGPAKRPNPEKQREYKNRWQSANKEKVALYQRRWRENGGREFMQAYEKKKRASDIGFRIAKSLRCRVRQTLKGAEKSAKTPMLLGCSVQSFRIYLESLFQDGMTWENYGSFWEIDHIIPCAIFDLSKAEHQKRCFHFSNQQPLTVTANRMKHTKTTAIIC